MSLEKRKQNRSHQDAGRDMISEGGPVVFDPTQVDGRAILPPYESQFSSPKTLGKFVEFFTDIPFDESMLEALLQEYLLAIGKIRTVSELRGLLGELFLDRAVNSAASEVPGIRKFPKEYFADDLEIAAVGIGYELFQHSLNHKGRPIRQHLDQFDGLILAETEDGMWQTVVLESKVTEINWIKNGLNSAINPKGARLHTEPLRKIFGSLGYGVAAAKDRISDSIPLQQSFKANGGVLLPFPFTVRQADEIAQRVAGSQSSIPE